MKRRFTILALGAISIAAPLSCSRELCPESSYADKVHEVIFEAGIGSSTKTAVTIEGTDVNVTWSDTDEDCIHLYENDVLGTGPSICTSKEDKSATFKATFSGTSAPYVYKAIIASDVLDGMPAIPAVQYPEETSFDSDADVLISRESSSYSSSQDKVSLCFARAAALSRLSFSGLNAESEAIESITITASNAIAGRLSKLDWTSGEVGYDDPSASKTIRLLYDEDNVITGGAFTAYFTSFPVATGDFTVCVTTDSHTLTKTISAGSFAFSLDTFSNLNIDMSSVTPVEPIDPSEVRDYGTFDLENAAVSDFLDYLEEHPYTGSDYTTTYISNFYKSGSISRRDHPAAVVLDFGPTLSGNFTLYADASCTQKVRTVAVDAPSLSISNLLLGKDYWFKITSNTSEILHQGKFSTEGRRRMMAVCDTESRNRCCNVRDLGGMRTTTENVVVKQGLIYRGSSMDKIKSGSDEAAVLIDDMNLGLDVDLRGEEANSIGIESLLVSLGSMPDDISKNVKKKLNAKVLTGIISTIKSGKATYLHCILGRDRTGWMCLLLEAVLGVSEGDCSMDFEFTSFSVEGCKLTERSEYFYKEPAYIKKFTASYTMENYDKQESEVYTGDTFQDYACNVFIAQDMTKAQIEEFKSLMLETDEKQYNEWK